MANPHTHNQQSKPHPVLPSPSFIYLKYPSAIISFPLSLLPQTIFAIYIRIDIREQPDPALPVLVADLVDLGLKIEQDTHPHPHLQTSYANSTRTSVSSTSRTESWQRV